MSDDWDRGRELAASDRMDEWDWEVPGQSCPRLNADACFGCHKQIAYIRTTEHVMGCSPAMNSSGSGVCELHYVRGRQVEITSDRAYRCPSAIVGNCRRTLVESLLSAAWLVMCRHILLHHGLAVCAFPGLHIANGGCSRILACIWSKNKVEW